MPEQPIEIFINKKIELMGKLLLHCVNMNNNKH